MSEFDPESGSDSEFRPYTPENDGPPDFLVKLGLAVPVSSDDVEQAYRDKVVTAHPDKGGDPDEFRELQTAYEQAKEYTRFRSSRRGWMAKQVDRYVAQQDVVVQLEARGAEVVVESIDWLNRSFGEGFATLASTIDVINLTGPEHGDDDLQFLADHAKQLADVRRLDLSHSRISNEKLPLIGKLTALTHLDLSHTAAAGNVVKLVLALEDLDRLDVEDTQVKAWHRMRLKLQRPDVEVIIDDE